MDISTIIWESSEYNSLERCVIKHGNNGIVVKSSITGEANDGMYTVEYELKTDLGWQVTYCKITTRTYDHTEITDLRYTGNGKWKLNGEDAPLLDECEYVDIPLTPFTNTLPINKLQLNIGATSLIKVVYLDVLARQVTAVQQKYTRLSANEYKYENVPNDFEAVITVEDNGFVADYPGLFKRIAASAEGTGE